MFSLCVVTGLSQMSLSKRITKLEDQRVGLCGPLVGKFVLFGQREPDFSFLDAVEDMCRAYQLLVEMNLQPPLLRALAIQLSGRYPGIGDRQVSEQILLILYLNISPFSPPCDCTPFPSLI